MKYLAAVPEEQRPLRLAGLAFLGAVWVLGLAAPRPSGVSLEFALGYSALMVLLAATDLTLPRPEQSVARKVLWLAIELALGVLAVRVHGTLIRPALVLVLPANRAILLFGGRSGLPLSLGSWVAYGINVGLDVWPNRLGEVGNYLSFFLGPYVVVVALSLVAAQQASARRHVEQLYRELEAAHQELQRLHRQGQELAVTRERNRIAREIHDSLAHYLTTINVQLEAAEKLGGDQPERALTQVRRARRLALECLREVRHSVAALRATDLRTLSLPSALERLAGAFRENTGIEVSLEFQAPEGLCVAPETALALYRAAQEGLTNVQRHAQAHKVRIRVAAQEGALLLTVEDDGMGPQEPRPAGENGSGETGGGFGLLGVRERVELLGGRMYFGARAQGGSVLEIVIPQGS